MKKYLLIDLEDSISMLYFKEVFQKWNIPLAVCTNPEDALIRFNIEKPNFVLMCADLQLDYKNMVSYLFSKKTELMIYGQKANELKLTPHPLLKAVFTDLYKMDLFVLKSFLFPDDILTKELLKETTSHIELVINEKVCIAEIQGGISWEKVHELKYHLIDLLMMNEIIGIIFIFHNIDKSDAALFENIEHLLKLKPLVELHPDSIQIISVEERIKTMIQDHPELNSIQFANSYIDAFLKIQGKQIKQKDAGTWIFKFKPNTVLTDDLYDEFGELVKKKGQGISEEEIQKLSRQNILNLYTAKELSYLGKSFNQNLNYENVLSNQAEGNLPQGQRKKTVLIVDDDSLTLKLLKKIIEKLDYEVLTASDGIEGFEYATNHNLDLLLVDLMMPGLNGVDLIKNYKELRGSSAAPIIVVSTISMRDVIQPILEMGADYVLKPVRISILINKINKLLR